MQELKDTPEFRKALESGKQIKIGPKYSRESFLITKKEGSYIIYQHNKGYDSDIAHLSSIDNIFQYCPFTQFTWEYLGVQPYWQIAR